MSKNKEIQCWDGDGTLPPEMSALIAENEKLKERINELRDEVRSQSNKISEEREEIRRLEEELREALQRLNEISGTVARPWKKIGDNDVRWNDQKNYDPYYEEKKDANLSFAPAPDPHNSYNSYKDSAERALLERMKGKGRDFA